MTSIPQNPKHSLQKLFSTRIAALSQLVQRHPAQAPRDCKARLPTLAAEAKSYGCNLGPAQNHHMTSRTISALFATLLLSACAAPMASRQAAEPVTVGVVVHGSGRKAGRGPGVNVLMTSPSGAIDAIITRKANLTELLGLQ